MARDTRAAVAKEAKSVEACIVVESEQSECVVVDKNQVREGEFVIRYNECAQGREWEVIRRRAFVNTEREEREKKER